MRIREDADTIMGVAMEKAKARRQAELETKPGYTQRKNMSKLEREVDAIEYLAKDMKRMSEQQGRDMSWEDARKTVEKVANLADRQRR